ncbi:GNAT family N-acetyltransferase [Aurantiacibacter spongiae]|uniref:GNAT family N-acetyltransferase n=2 Tax=Aurantiacibacter spongiae TaxID=2488860 RepID=A0A3N5CTW9_9SPHN|nr:GNAT family N-acetyltransferase [Aurantiacibacter spongiae]
MSRPAADARAGRAGPAMPARIAGPAVTLTARDWRDFDRPDRIAAWDALAEWAVEPNPFYESWFLLPSLRAFDPAARIRLLVLEVDGQIAGLMPVKREARYYGYPMPHLRNWCHANCFLGLPLVARGFERLFWRELLVWCDKATRMRPFLHLAHMPGDGVLASALEAELMGAGRRSAIVMREERAMLRSRLSPDGYLARSLSPKKRKELRRQRRRLEDAGNLFVDSRTDAEGLARWAQDFLALEARGWKGRAGSALACNRDTRSLFGAALRGAGHTGRLHRLSLTLDGRPIAMLATFLAGRGAFSFKTAFDEDYARFSPGVLLQCEALRLIERGGTNWVDSCAGADHPMIDHFWRERRLIVRRSIAIGGPLRRGAFDTLARMESSA